MIRVIGPREVRSVSGPIINTTSTSKEEWSKRLSPFHVGPVNLYNDMVAMNVENAWQFSKVYAQHTGPDGEPNEDYWQWAKRGWASYKPYRYPMGKGAIPEYSYWDGQHLTYVEARKAIYIPLYSDAVRRTHAFDRLIDEYNRMGFVTLFDFDGYDWSDKWGVPLDEVINNPDKKMGHAFVLAKLLIEEAGEGM